MAIPRERRHRACAVAPSAVSISSPGRTGRRPLEVRGCPWHPWIRSEDEGVSGRS
jgi:hypothetical protein